MAFILHMNNVQGWIKIFTSPIILDAEYVKLLNYVVHGYTQNRAVLQEHSCNSSTWWPSWKNGLALKLEELYAFLWTQKMSTVTMQQQLVEVYGKNVLSRGCEIMLHVCIWQEQWDGQQLKWMIRFLNNRSQHRTHQRTHSDEQMCNFEVYVLQYCKMVASHFNRWQQGRKNDSLCPATIYRTGKQLSPSSHLVMWHRPIISLSPASNQSWSENTLAHPGRKSLQWHHIVAKFCQLPSWNHQVYWW